MLLRKPPTWMPGATRARSRALVARPDPRVDALLDRYVEWRDECAAVHGAYQQWISSDRADHGLAYAAYRAALDREQKAAAVYQLIATQLVGPAREPHER